MSLRFPLPGAVLAQLQPAAQIAPATSAAAGEPEALPKLATTAGQALAQLDPGWVLALGLGFPLLMLLLGEALRWLQRHRAAYVPPLAILRHWVLPALAAYLILVELLARPRAALGVRLSETLVWITLILAALSLLNVILFEGAPRGSWQAKVPKLFRDLGRFLLVLIGSAIVLSSVWGADLGGLITALGVGSLVLGLALQDSLGNIFSGLALLFEQPIGMGDWVKIGDSTGEVVEVNWRSVHLRTESNDLLVIPNAELAKGQFTNFSRPTAKHRVEIPIAFSYDDPPNRVRQLLIEAALEIPGVSREPAPDVVVENYGDFAISYRIEFYSQDFPAGDGLRDEFNRRLWYVARRHRLTMPYPVRQHLPYQPGGISPEQNRISALRLLGRTPGFAALSLARLEQLLGEAELLSYAAGELVLARQADLLGLYLIVAGEAELLLPDSLGHPCSLGVLQAGECFGERSILLHGRIADTTVRARHDLEVLLIPVETLQQLLLESPRLAADLAEVLEIRHRAMVSAPGDAELHAATADQTSSPDSSSSSSSSAGGQARLTTTGA